MAACNFISLIRTKPSLIYIHPMMRRVLSQVGDALCTLRGLSRGLAQCSHTISVTKHSETEIHVQSRFRVHAATLIGLHRNFGSAGPITAWPLPGTSECLGALSTLSLRGVNGTQRYYGHQVSPSCDSLPPITIQIYHLDSSVMCDSVSESMQ